MATPYVLKSSFDPGALRVDYDHELNAEQLAVVKGGDGPCLVLAGAGSGKTRTIVYRVAYLIEHGVSPDHILLVTFTNKAAKEMLGRVESLLGSFPAKLWGGTFHHIANVLMRKYARLVGFEPNFTILDEDDSRDLVGACLKSLRIDTKQMRFPSVGVIRGLISLSQNTGIDLATVIAETKPEFSRVQDQLVTVARAYDDRKRRANAMDFDDLLVRLRDLLRDHPEVCERLGQQFKYILVDEYQDTNHLQADIVQRLAQAHKNIIVVGDDAQSIYAFRGADIQNILNFPKLFSKTKLFKLQVNYRSTQPILDVANEVIKHNVEQFPKRLEHVRAGSTRPIMIPAASDEQEAEFVAQRILELRDDGVPLRDMAVLFRAAFHSQALEFELTRRDIPYEYRGGLRFFDRAHIKDALAFLKVVGNPRDEVSFLRILRQQVGIGDQTADQLFTMVQDGLGVGDERHPLEAVFETVTPPTRAERGWKTLRGMLETLVSQRDHGPEALIKTILESDYRDYVKNQYQDANDRLADLDQLALFAGKYDSLSTFLSEVTLQESFGVADAQTPSETREQIVLSTVHQAKGLEWRAVFIIHLSDASFPHPRALTEEGGLEEERRLFYVAVTRAQEFLYLSYGMASGYRTTAMQLNSPSPFLKEIPTQLLETYELSEEIASAEETFEDPDRIIDLDDDGKPKSLLDRVIHSHVQKRERRSAWKKK